jgi:hypothetical protein
MWRAIFFAMLEHLRLSPIFSSNLSMRQLQSILTSLQRAFQNEEVRVAAVVPQRIDVKVRAEVIKYYTHAFLSLHPLLLPIVSLVLGIKPSANSTIRDLAISSANVFCSRHPIRDVEENIKMGPWNHAIKARSHCGHGNVSCQSVAGDLSGCPPRRIVYQCILCFCRTYGTTDGLKGWYIDLMIRYKKKIESLNSNRKDHFKDLFSHHDLHSRLQ